MSKSFQELVTHVNSLPAARKAAGVVYRAVQITAEDAMYFLGIEAPSKGKTVPRPDEGLRNLTNRPYSVGAAKQIAAAILDGEYEFTGESMIFSNQGITLDGQHRLGGLLWATHWWQRALDNGTLDEVYPTWADRKPFIEVLLVLGPQGAGQVRNKINTGRSRSTADVIYQDYRFGPDFKQKDRIALAKIVAPASRLVWGRINGKLIRNTPKMDQREAMTFVHHHPGIPALCEFVYALDREPDNIGCVGRLIPPSVLAGMGYLMAVARTPPGLGQANTVDLDFSLYSEAKEFIQSLVRGDGLQAGSPILLLRNALLAAKTKSSGKRARDARIGLLVMAWNRWIDGQKEGLRLSDIIPEEGADPRLGGLDSAG